MPERHEERFGHHVLGGPGADAPGDVPLQGGRMPTDEDSEELRVGQGLPDDDGVGPSSWTRAKTRACHGRMVRCSSGLTGGLPSTDRTHPYASSVPPCSMIFAEHLTEVATDLLLGSKQIHPSLSWRPGRCLYRCVNRLPYGGRRHVRLSIYVPSAIGLRSFRGHVRHLVPLAVGARRPAQGPRQPGIAATALGASVTDTTLGGYSLIRAGTLDAASALARGCPMLNDGGAIEICELTSHDERFDRWLDTVGPRHE